MVFKDERIFEPIRDKLVYSSNDFYPFLRANFVSCISLFFFFLQIIGRTNLNETNVRQPKERVSFGDISCLSIVGRKFI